MRISTRIRLTIVIVVGLVLISSLIALQSAHRLRNDHAALTAYVIPFIEGIEQLRYLGTRSLASAVGVGFVEHSEKVAEEGSEDAAASTEHSEDEAAEFEEEAVEPFKKLLAEIGARLPTHDEERWALLEEIERRGSALISAGRNLIEQVDESGAGHAQILQAKETLEDYEDEFLASIGAAIDAQHQSLEAHSAVMNSTVRTSMMACAAAAVLVVLIGVAAWLLQGRLVVTPLCELEEAAAQLAGGDFDARVQVRSEDEIGKVGQTFNEMAEALSKSISASYLNKLIDSIPDPLLVVDDGRRIIRANPAAQRMLALGGDETTETRLSDVFHGEGLAHIEAMTSSQVAVLDAKAEWTTAKGSIPVSVSAASLQEEGAKLGEAVIVAKDMTEWNRTVEELERSNHELNQFAYIASHDLKSPLRAIANLSEWIAEDLGDELDEEVAENITLLRSRVHRMEALIQGILEYSRIGRQAVDVELVDARKLVEETVEALPVPEGFCIDVDGDLPQLRAPRVRLAQVFSNLIGNALKYHDRPDGRINISASNGGNFYTFTVADDGPGIDPAYHEKVFAIFQTLAPKDRTESTGIGLTLVKRIVEEHGGHIDLESDVGQGAIFRFSWPIGVAA